MASHSDTALAAAPVDATPVTQPRPAQQPTEPATPRDAQRQALSELIRLGTECVFLDAQIEKTLTDTTAAADKALKFRSNVLSASSLEKLGELQRLRADALAVVEQKFAAEKAAVEAQHREQKQKIAADYDNHSGRIKQQFQDALWEAESVMDSTVEAAKRAHKATLEKADADRAALDEQRGRSLQFLTKYGHQHRIDQAIDLPRVEGIPADDFDAGKANVATTLDKLGSLTLANVFAGVWPLLIAVAAVAGAIAATAPWERNFNQEWQLIVGAGAGALVLTLILWFVLYRLSNKQVARTFDAFVDALAKSHAALDQRLADAEALRKKTIADAEATRQSENARIKAHFQPIAEKAKTRRDEMNRQTTRSHEATSQLVAGRREAEIRATRELHESGIRAAERDRDGELAAEQKQRDQTISAAQARYDAGRAELEARWNAGLVQTKAQNAITDAPGCVRFGSLRIDLSQIAGGTGVERGRLVPPPPYDVPAWLALPRQASLLIEHDRDARDRAIDLLRAAMFSLLQTLPPGRCKFTLLDPVGLGQSFAGFMHLADYDESLVGGRIWSEQDQIEQRLADLTEHMETVIQKYLRNEFATIDEYNEQAGELAEPYRFLVIGDLPTSFTDEAMRRLANIAASGARCGVYVLCSRDLRVPIASPTLLEDLRNSCTTLTQKERHFEWRDPIYGRFSFTPAPAPEDGSMTAALHEIGRRAKASKRIEVPFHLITPPPEKMWSGDSSSEVDVPVGRTGATRLQSFRLGRGVAQHALLAGKTGSGKSTLLNVLITNLALWYSPDELELYLIDFKRGVEFKAYAEQKLPHARAIAVESDREFGLSVLQRLDAELGRRGEMYRKLGVQDVAGYRREAKKLTGDANTRSPSAPLAALPRILLIIDEFQELFTEDDKLGQEAALLIDRLVRQGRAFGIHLVLGSQTLGGATTLPRTTMGQMAVRVALQTTEADSQLILGDDNSAARLLTRPGEAIYNDAGGAVEHNSPFQVTWLGDDEREVYLKKVYEKAKSDGRTLPHIAVFEGNAPAHIEDNRPLASLVEKHSTLTAGPGIAPAMLGEAVAIKPPTTIQFRKRAGANALLLGQQEEQAMAVLASASLSLAAALPGGMCRFVLLDATPVDSALHGKLAHVLAATTASVQDVPYRDAGAALSALVDELHARQDGTASDAQSVFLLVNGLQRYRDLRKKEESFSFSLDDAAADAPKATAPDKAFVELLREGPAHGIHVLGWVDTVAALDRTIERNLLREFDHRVLFQMSAADSSHLIDSPAANKLGFHRAIYFSEEQGVIEKFRPYGLPNEAFLDQVRRGLGA